MGMGNPSTGSGTGESFDRLRNRGILRQAQEQGNGGKDFHPFVVRQPRMVSNLKIRLQGSTSTSSVTGQTADGIRIFIPTPQDLRKLTSKSPLVGARYIVPLLYVASVRKSCPVGRCSPANANPER
jgi:hypothetical protein